MKKYLLSATLLLASAFTFAQTTTYKLNVHLKNGSTQQFELTDVERLTFTGGEEDPEPAATPVRITIPESFSSSYVQKVMSGDKQIAEIDREYIKKINKQVTTIYPCGDDGRAILTKGMTSTGASVVWDLDANTATVGDEGEALTAVYLVDGEIVTTCDGESTDGTITPDVINDNRGLFERNTYKIVKIGTQYWMAENLRATYFTDGSKIDGISESDASAWKANTTGAYMTEPDSDWLKIAGYLYNGYCVTNEKGLAPEGWEIPTRDQLAKLRTAGNLKTTNFMDSEVGSWALGKEGSNLTGFSAVANGYYSTATNQSQTLSDAYFWSSTSLYDALFKSYTLEYFRINASATNTTLSNSNGHDYAFGHSIRCVRK